MNDNNNCIIDRLKFISEYKSIAEVVDMLGISLDILESKLMVHESTIDQVKNSIFDENGKLNLLFESIREQLSGTTYYLPEGDDRVINEVDRQILSYNILSILTYYAREYMTVDTAVTSKMLLYPVISDNYIIPSYISICTWHDGIQPILSVFSAKANNIALGAGQMLLESIQMYETTHRKIYAIVTDAISWQLYSYEVVGGRKVIEKFPVLSLEYADLDVESTCNEHNLYKIASLITSTLHTLFHESVYGISV